MNNHKLHLLPLFILITGLVTLTAGCKKKDMSLKLNEPRNIRGVVSYKRSFPDLNDKHLAVAQAVGICPPEDRDAAEKMKEQPYPYHRQPILHSRLSDAFHPLSGPPRQ